MIQRIQTLFLILVIIAGIVFMFIPAAIVVSDDGIIHTFNGIGDIYTTILESLTVIIALITIMCYKKRILQIRLSAFNLVLQIGMPFLVWVIMDRLSNGSENDWHVQAGLGLPLVQAILTLLSIKYIFRDIIIIRNLDRLR